MDADNIIFSSKVDQQVEDLTFDMLFNEFLQQDYKKVFVKNVSLAEGEIIFFTEIDGKESIVIFPLLFGSVLPNGGQPKLNRTSL